MARHLLDTNVLLRIADVGDRAHGLAADAIAALIKNHDEPVIATQNVIEFWAVGTRPAAVNGVGWTPVQVAAEVRNLLQEFPIVEEKPSILAVWLDLVARYAVSGKAVHDARLVALMISHGISDIVTFNLPNFARYSEIRAVHPSAVPRP